LKIKYSKRNLILIIIFIVVFTYIPSTIIIKKVNSNNQNENTLFLSNVLGDDDRIRITPTTSYPWSTIVKLRINWGGSNYIGSGAIIDKNHVLTAGHCVYQNSLGGWADSIKVSPAVDNGNEPYGYA